MNNARIRSKKNAPITRHRMTRLISREHIRWYNTARCLPVVRFGIFDIYSQRANRARRSEPTLWRHYAPYSAATSRSSASPRIANLKNEKLLNATIAANTSIAGAMSPEWIS